MISVPAGSLLYRSGSTCVGTMLRCMTPGWSVTFYIQACATPLLLDSAVSQMGHAFFFSFRYQFSNVSEISEDTHLHSGYASLLRLIGRSSVGTTRQAAVGWEVVKVRMNGPPRSETRVLIDLAPRPDAFQILDQEILVECRGRRSTSARQMHCTHLTKAREETSNT